MTTKEAIHAKVEQLDDLKAEIVLDYLERMLMDDEQPEEIVDRTEAQRAAMLSLIGMVRSPQPTNIAEHKDDYLADAILHPDESNA